MLKIKDRIKGKINQIEANGIGTFYVGKEKVLVRNVLLNEEVEVCIDKRVKEGYVGIITKIIVPSKNRVAVKCPHYLKCGSCQLLHINYAAQLEMKKQMIVDMLKKSTCKDIEVMDCEGMEYPYAYRNKIIISFGKDKREMVAGFYEEFSHRIIPISSCLLHEDYTNTLIEDLKLIVKKSRIEPYEEDTRRGFLRHILIRRAVKSNQSMIVLVGVDKVFKAKNNFLKLLKQMHPEVNTVVLNVNSRKTSVVLGDVEQILYGRGYIQDILCDKKFSISSKSFYQINHEQCEKLYTKALSLLSLSGNEVIIDAYSGVGTIGIIAANKVKQVYSVELNKDAVHNAIQNARNNDIKNVVFKCDDAGKFMLSLAHEKKVIDAIIMDPAREGSDENFLSSIVKLNPKEVIYISCNPQTQIRDMEYLRKYGYTVEKMYLYDLFPNTFHVESIVKLNKKR